MQADIDMYENPPTPAFAKAGAAPGTTAGVELAFLLAFACLPILAATHATASVSN